MLTMYVQVLAIICFLLDRTRIVKGVLGGTEAKEFSHPYQASLQVYQKGNWQHFCGAVLIDADKLVTAGHCLSSKFTSTRVMIGTVNIEKDEQHNMFSQTRDVSKSIIHPSYRQPGERNDIAVIYLNKPVILNENVKVAEMAPPGSSFEGENCVIVGWGVSEGYPQGSSHLREAFLKAIPTAKCAKFDWDKPISNKEICLFDETEEEPDKRARTCQGDGGSALMCGLKYQYLAGVSSAGGIGCTGTMPSIYTRLSEYTDWINSV